MTRARGLVIAGVVLALGACAHGGTGRLTKHDKVQAVASSCARAGSPREGRNTPNREDVMASLVPIRQDIAKCFSGSGTATIVIVVEGATGRVVLVRIGGPRRTDGCVERVFAGVCFEPFSSKHFTVTFPFKVGPR